MAQASRTLPVSGPWGGGRLRTGLKTIILRECAVIARFWSLTLAPPVVTTLLYFAIFGKILGKRIGSFSGIDYLRYLSPGLIVLWVIPHAFGHTASAFSLGSFVTALFAKSFEQVEAIQLLVLAPLLAHGRGIRDYPGSGPAVRGRGCEMTPKAVSWTARASLSTTE
ncbi:MAG TPA: hypothetical protein VHV80_05765 [Steroidobacteraceae bacterium]|jgi:hypothetical protein|nr:hypothetical protein [Steroidobacteraceae bacterium]